MTATRKPVIVFGTDHSPLVQSVLLGLFEKEIPYRLITAPPRRVFKRSGVLMPAVNFSGEDWVRESEDILVAAGFQKITPEDEKALNKVFSIAVHRVESGFKLWRGWSLVKDGEPSALKRFSNHFFRSFVALYFHSLLLMLNHKFPKLKRANCVTPYLHWQQQFLASDGPFIDGQKPGTRDLMLFGQIQCHASIPGAPIAAIEESPELQALRAWMANMHERFATYPHLYSGARFTPRAATPTSNNLAERTSFWLGGATMILALPLTLPLVMVAMKRARSAGVRVLGANKPKRPKATT